MGNCLVTKLKSVVDNDMLVHLGNEQLVIDNWVNWDGGVSTTTDEEFTLKIKSNHEFTDITHQQHLGKEIIMNAAQQRTIMRFNALNGETGPAIVELGKKNNILRLEGNYPLNENSYGYTTLNYISCEVDIEPENLGKLFPRCVSYQPQYGKGGNIIEIANWDSVVAVLANNNFTGDLEPLLVAKYNRPQSAQMAGPGRYLAVKGTQAKYVTFNGIGYPGRELYAAYADTIPYITVKLGGSNGTNIGTWDGTSWTYTD